MAKHKKLNERQITKLVFQELKNNSSALQWFINELDKKGITIDFEKPDLLQTKIIALEMEQTMKDIEQMRGVLKGYNYK